MKRRDARELIFKLTYEMVMTGEYNPDTLDGLVAELPKKTEMDDDSRKYITDAVSGISEHRETLKALITKYARGYEFDRIYKTDLAVLYLACYELLYTDTPRAVIVNEAVELAKIYSDVQSYSFVNGILASVIKGDAE